jgi:homoserine kinase
MDKQVRVFAPATVANVGCAFDILGFAVAKPGDEVSARLTSSPGVVIKEIFGDNGKLPLDPWKNTAGVSAAAFLNHIGAEQGIELSLKKQMPLGSGLGSSSASSAAAVYAANLLFDSALAVEDLLPFAMEGEKAACGAPHADNVAPALLGGFILVRSYNPLDIIKIPAPDKLVCTIVHPIIEINTSDARKILKKEVPLARAVSQWGNVAGLIAGLMKSDYDLIGRSLEDFIVEPTRSMLIPGFDSVKSAALSKGAIGCGISGSGPSIFALSTGSDTAASVGEAMKLSFSELEIDSSIYISKINDQGPLILKSPDPGGTD